MIPFSTEFPIKAVTTSEFIAEVIGWLRGTSYSTVLDNRSIGELDNVSAHLKSETGEELQFLSLETGQSSRAIGFRHEFPDDSGRIWRTEAVVTRFEGSPDSAVIRVRT